MLAKWVQVVFCFQIRFMRFFWRSKQSQTDRLVIDFNFGEPFLVFLANAGKSTFVVFALTVLRVLRVSGFSQIADAIVRSVAVNVIQLMRGPFTINVQPCQPMRGVKNVIEPDCNVAMSHSASGYIARSASSPRHVPAKNSRVWVVGHKRFETVLRNSFAVHDLNNIKQVGGCQA